MIRHNHASVITDNVALEENSYDSHCDSTTGVDCETQVRASLAGSSADGDSHNSEAIIEGSPVSLSSSDDVKSFIAKWLLKISETRSLTQTASTGIVEDVGALIDYVVQHLSSKACDTLANNEIDSTVISQVREIFSSAIAKAFEGLHTFHHQL